MRTESVYRICPGDPQARVIEKGKDCIFGDGIHDDTPGLREVIRSLKERDNFGIVFIPSGTYLITDTIWIPKAIRLIGVGETRPVIRLADHAEGFDMPHPEDKGGAKYMLWFTDSVPEEGKEVRDANPGTFYSALSNIDLEIGEGNPYAVALRTHYAQHCFISDSVIRVGSGLAGVFDAGNETENVRFEGGQYGILTTKCSPGWPFILLDCEFEGQTNAAIRSRELGLTALRCVFRNVPRVIDGFEGFMDKVYLEDSLLENVSGSAFRVYMEKNTLTQWNLLNVLCRNVPTPIEFAESGKTIGEADSIYRIAEWTHGVHVTAPGDPGRVTDTLSIEPYSGPFAVPTSDLAPLPDVTQWGNARDFGAVGDGVTDDTRALQKAMATSKAVYLPQGVYRVTETLVMGNDTALIGLNPISTRIYLPENIEAFGGPGSAKPLLDSGVGGKNILNGIGIDTGARNPRAVGVRWRAGADSYMNDVKFLGGHGSMGKGEKGWTPSYNASRTGDPDPARKWNAEYWSLWVTDGGGGVFKDIWSASTYCAAGVYISDTETPGRIYCMSVEHHVRSEVKLKNVCGWRIYGLQTEEEVAESQVCQPLELENCRSILFATYYAFRVIWLPNPYPCAVKTWDSGEITWKNLHNYTQVKYTLTDAILDGRTGETVRPWQIAKYIQPMPRLAEAPELPEGVPVRLYTGFEFADGAAADSKGNFVFCDGRSNRIYAIDGENFALTLVRDVPIRPLSLAFDTAGNLIVVSEFTYPLGALRDGKPMNHTKPADAKGTSYGGWYQAEAHVVFYAMDPADPERTMRVLPKVPSESIPRIARMLHPGNRWRDDNSYTEACVSVSPRVTVAPDGVTVFPDFYDFIRSNTLAPAVPGKPYYAVDEYYKRIYSFTVRDDGFLKDPKVTAECGEYSALWDEERSRLYAADQDVIVMDGEGHEISRITLPERPATLALGGKGHDILLVTARSSVYAIRLPMRIS